MNKEQEGKLNRIYDDEFPGPCIPGMAKIYIRKGYEGCLEANGIGEELRIPDGYFKIGEEVEANLLGKGWVKAVITATVIGRACTEDPKEVRRIPAWTPKEGEAVLFYTRDDSDTLVGVFARGAIHAKDTAWPIEDCHYKPFNVDGHGKPWSEI